MGKNKFLIWFWIFADHWKKLGKDKNSRMYAVLSHIAFLPFTLIHMYSVSMTFITRFPPFSLLFTDKIFHYQNKYYKYARTIIENEMEKDNKPISIEQGDQDQYFYTLIGKFTKPNVDNPDKNILHAIEKSMALPSDTIFIRRDGENTIRFLIPK